MDNGSVFADFARFSDRGYAKAHRTILVRTRADGGAHELRVVAVDAIEGGEKG